MANEVEIVWLCARQDDDEAMKLLEHAVVLESELNVRSLHRSRLQAGEDEEATRRAALCSADIVVVLATAKGMALWVSSLRAEVERNVRPDVPIVPVLLSTCALPADLSRLASLPKDGQWIQQRGFPEEGRMAVVEGLRPLAVEIAEARASAVGRPPGPRRSVADRLELDLEWPRKLMKADVPRDIGPTGRGVNVVLLDTPVDLAHPDLDGRIRQVETAHAHGTDKAHGTHIAGIIVGERCGIAPGARLLSYPIGPRAPLEHFVEAFCWIGQELERGEKIDIVNISLGLPGFQAADVLWPLVQSLARWNILVVCAVGDGGRNATASPGNYDVPLSVGACAPNATISAFSGSGRLQYLNHKYTVPDVVAPGEEILSCSPGGRYARASGTPCAAAMVTGVAALLWEDRPRTRALEIKDALLATARRFSGVSEVRQGAGLVQCDAADFALPPRSRSRAL